MAKRAYKKASPAMASKKQAEKIRVKLGTLSNKHKIKRAYIDSKFKKKLKACKTPEQAKRVNLDWEYEIDQCGEWYRTEYEKITNAG